MSDTDKSLILYDLLIESLIQGLKDNPENVALLKEARETLKWLDVKANPQPGSRTAELKETAADVPFPRERERGFSQKPRQAV